MFPYWCLPNQYNTIQIKCTNTEKCENVYKYKRIHKYKYRFKFIFCYQKCFHIDVCLRAWLPPLILQQPEGGADISEQTFLQTEQNIGNIGKTLEKHWKNIRKTLEKHWKNIGKTLEKRWKNIGKTLEKHWKTFEKHLKNIGKVAKHLRIGNMLRKYRISIYWRSSREGQMSLKRHLSNCPRLSVYSKLLMS